MTSRNKCAVEYLHERFTLDRRTGKLYWKYYAGFPKRWNTRWAGREAGSLNKSEGYVDVGIDNVNYRAHVIIFAMVKGYWPENEVDHRNRVRNDNRPRNLREATKAEQRQNAGLRSDSTSGYVGVTWDKRRRKWIAQIYIGGRHHYVGQFDTPELAHEAYKQAKRKLHPFQPKSA